MANKIDVALWELTKDEAAHLPEGTQMLIYNPFTDDFKIERIGKNCLARHKHASPNLKYFSFRSERDDQSLWDCLEPEMKTNDCSDPLVPDEEEIFKSPADLVEELARTFCGFSATLKCSECSYECYQKEYARKAFEAGYRLASDVIKEFEQILTVEIIGIEEDFFHGTAAHWDATRKKCYEELLAELADLKKKYVEVWE